MPSSSLLPSRPRASRAVRLHAPPARPRAGRRVLLLAALLGLVAAPAAGVAQGAPPDPAAHRAGMRRLAYMAGEWTGEGWIARGRERVAFRGGERVQWKLDSLALLVEGRFTAPGADGAEVPVHTTLGVISFDPRQARYPFHTWLATGSAGEHELTLHDDGWSWGFEVPTGRIRYRTTFAGDTWHEVGDFSRDGERWDRFFEMRLVRAGE